MPELRVVILCGGSGTRLWPLSRKQYPKQFMDMGGHTLFGDTLRRASCLPHATNPLVVCNTEHRFLAAATMQTQHISGQIILEPQGRNTAPAIAIAAFAATEGGGDPLLLVLPSDHLISPQESFTAAVEQASVLAEKGMLVTFGVEPSAPETGYGYIQRGERLADCPAPGFRVHRFTEKPCLNEAQAMIATGEYYWNSGMFLFRASVYLKELELHSPEIFSASRTAWEAKLADMDFIRLDLALFNACPSNSIDYAVMEKTTQAAVVPLPCSWSDLGSWESVYESESHDEQGNVLIGDVIAQDIRNCYLHSSKRLVAALGVENLIIVETADAILISHRDASQDVKKIVTRLENSQRSEKDTHIRVLRPWGSYEVLILGDLFQVKRISVNPGNQLSLQMHHHRAEHWTVVRGTGLVRVGNEERLLKEDESIYIPLGTQHRLENPGCIPLEIIEVQSGTYLGEDDIVRLEDTYGRCSHESTR